MILKRSVSEVRPRTSPPDRGGVSPASWLTAEPPSVIAGSPNRSAVCSGSCSPRAPCPSVAGVAACPAAVDASVSAAAFGAEFSGGEEATGREAAPARGGWAGVSGAASCGIHMARDDAIRSSYRGHVRW
ncbi:MAG: hypothetical protein ACK55Z_32840, partial [bacterium]